jgi:hypothetical protein
VLPVLHPAFEGKDQRTEKLVTQQVNVFAVQQSVKTQNMFV